MLSCVVGGGVAVAGGGVVAIVFVAVTVFFFFVVFCCGWYLMSDTAMVVAWYSPTVLAKSAFSCPCKHYRHHQAAVASGVVIAVLLLALLWCFLFFAIVVFYQRLRLLSAVRVFVRPSGRPFVRFFMYFLPRVDFFSPSLPSNPLHPHPGLRPSPLPSPPLALSLPLTLHLPMPCVFPLGAYGRLFRLFCSGKHSRDHERPSHVSHETGEVSSGEPLPGRRSAPELPRGCGCGRRDDGVPHGEILAYASNGCSD